MCNLVIVANCALDVYCICFIKYNSTRLKPPLVFCPYFPSWFPVKCCAHIPRLTRRQLSAEKHRARIKRPNSQSRACQKVAKPPPCATAPLGPLGPTLRVCSSQKSARPGGEKQRRDTATVRAPGWEGKGCRCAAARQPWRRHGALMKNLWYVLTNEARLPPNQQRAGRDEMGHSEKRLHTPAPPCALAVHR